MSDILDELQKEYDAVCQRIDPSAGQYSFLTERSDNGAPHVEYADGIFYHVVTERGLELERKSYEKDDLLFKMVSDMAFWMAVGCEFKNRIEGQDARRIIFSKWVELMERVSAEWGALTLRKIDKTLEENPFLDRR